MIFKSLIIAFSMYSRIPMPKVEWNEKSMRYSFCFFPIIGVIIGAFMWSLGKFLINIDCGNLLFGCIMTVVPVFITGGIHFDGFLDTMDGINSYGDKEKRLSILKDSNSGAFAIIGGLLYFTLSIGFWSEVDSHALNIIVLGYTLSRALSALSVVTFPMAKNTGLLATFGNSANKMVIKITMTFFIIIDFIISIYIDFIGGLTMFLAAGGCFFYHYYNCVKNFGGITGDLAGYFLQVCELFFVIIGVVVFKYL